MEAQDLAVRISDLEAEVRALRAERDALHRALGLTAAVDIIALVQSLEEQLTDLYSEREAQLAQ